jgi:hypothetical protein
LCYTVHLLLLCDEGGDGNDNEIVATQVSTLSEDHSDNEGEGSEGNLALDDLVPPDPECML